MKQKIKNIIISGGGTGGHVFPAISIANAIKEMEPDTRILFVGAKGKLEMEKVPAAGYNIIGLPVSGLQRKLTIKNIRFIVNLISSLQKAKKIIKEFKPDVVVGVGGYASGPVLYKANKMGIPTLIQEQNSYAGITNKMLAKKAKKICVAYEGMEKYFPKNKIILTGNPVRQNLLNNIENQAEAIKKFELQQNKKTILVIGGSLGAKTINQSIIKNIEKIGKSEFQLLWQTGKYYYKNVKEIVTETKFENIRALDFITNMNTAYAAADIIISRAGAGTISELCLVGKPVILVPSPNVAEDHQTKNAMALVKNNAAIMVKDTEAEEQLVDTAINLIKNEKQLKTISENIKKMALHDSAKKIAEEILKLN